MYKVSVIIPVYNAEKTLRKCVESLVYSIEKNIEILLIDDCSIDRSWELCRKLAAENSNVFCYKNDINRGVSFTRNRGLELATAPYVLFVDSDDWVSSKYIDTLLSCISDNMASIPICGYTFIDNVNGSRYYYGTTIDDEKVISFKNAFYLLDKILLQQLWNKIFNLNIIRESNIRFDESLSMGEDFQFVLDYFYASNFDSFVLIPESLYYYVRANNNSLMGKWDSMSLNKMLLQYDSLYNICNDDSDSMKEVLVKHKKKLENSYIYHIIRNKNYSYEERQKKLNSLLEENELKQLYKNQQILILKEKIVSNVVSLKKFCKRVYSKLQQVKIRYIICKAQRQLKSDKFSIISQNCIGGVLYSDMKMQFLSPTINTFIPEPDFIKFVSNLEYYMNQDIVMSWAEEYPVGLLDDVHVHFMHYDNCSDAKECWERRKKRINWNKIFILSTDRDGFDDESYEGWKKLEYVKVLFTVNHTYTEDCVHLDDVDNTGYVYDLISKREFYKDGYLIKKINQLKEK